MNDVNSATSDWKARRSESLVRLASWTGAWLVATALATFGPVFLWEADWLTGLGILVNLGIGIGMIFANINYVKSLDELMQKIQLQAMGVTLGVGLVGGIGYSLLDVTNLISSDAELSYLIMLMGITYLISAIAGVRRYQ